jgi:2',3'-cyclic-nucleotide 2'-phosphodiesterase/3'-nucleotidase
VDSLRGEWGGKNVILVDAGDCLQGDNASYYYNFVDTAATHLFARMVDRIGYDAVVVGNHDIETGHLVYDRVRKQMRVPFLAANALDAQTGKPYFQEYVLLKRHGLKIAVIGFTNPNIAGWLSPELWSGLEFKNLMPYAQEVVDKVLAEAAPDVVIVAAHTGAGEGDGSRLENQGLDLYKSLSGVDFVVCAHDHRPLVKQNDSICLINSGSHCRNLGHGVVTLTVKDGKVVSKTLEGALIPVSAQNADDRMRSEFRSEFEAVRTFTKQELGELEVDLCTRDAYAGMSDYLNLLHTLSLRCAPAQISFAAPLTFNGTVKAGTVIYNDLFTIYPYENQLYVVKMTGKEIKDYLEYSYDAWINTVSSADDRLLKITDRPDPRTGQKAWSFINRSYNFDSAGGLVYTVDVTKPYGQRILIQSLADGNAFNLTAEYNVAMTSYRASGGGSIMRLGAGIDTDNIADRIVAYHPELREILYDYLVKNGEIAPEKIGDPAVVGSWKFIPESLAEKALQRDMDLLF